MAWIFVDTADPLGVTRYVAQPSQFSGCAVDVYVHRDGCKAWRLGSYADAKAATAGIEDHRATVKAKRAELDAERQHQEGGK